MGQIHLSRRNVLSGIGALSASALLAGCSKSGSEDPLYIQTGDYSEPDFRIPTNELIYRGSSPSNCGGRCVLVAHVRNGVIKRFTTDERPDRTLDSGLGDDPQRRACLRCRGKRGWIYRKDRILYPLKQTKERGDVSGFIRISWDQAAKEIAEKMKKIGDYTVLNKGNNDDIKFKGDSATGTYKGQWGQGAFINMHNCGDAGTVCSGNGLVAPFINVFGASASFKYGMYSYPQAQMSVQAAAGNSLGDVVINSNSKQDMLNAELIVSWGLSIADGVQETGTMYYLIQAKNKGIQLVDVDTYRTNTAQTLDIKSICPVPGTDVAMICAMVYHLLEKHIAAVPLGQNPRAYDTEWLKISDIDKYTIGLFDDLTPTLYRNADGSTVGNSNISDIPQRNIPTVTPMITESEYSAPAGASFSAYLFGSDVTLVKSGLNLATSIYPETIGYNVRPPKHLDTNDAGDELYDKNTSIYGQVKKTPEWASKICGVSAENIRWLAEQIATKKTFLIGGGGCGGGAQRTPEGEQIGFALITLSVITGCFGTSGRSFGAVAVGRKNTNAPASYMPAEPRNNEIVKKAQITTDIININRANLSKLSNYNPTAQMGSALALTQIELYMWMDNAEWGGTGKSKWYDPATMYCPPVRAMINGAGNTVNQSGDCMENIRVMTKKNSDGSYRLEFVLTIDPFMTPTAQYADYVLPPALHFEKEGLTANWSQGNEAVLYIPKAIDAPGQAKTELDIYEMIADKVGKKVEVNGNISIHDSIREAYISYVGTDKAAPSFEEFKERGIYTKSGTQKPLDIKYQTFRDNPVLNPLTTVTGKFQIYSQSWVEDYEARRYNNFDNISGSGNTGKLIIGKDANGDDVLGSGRLYTKACTFTGRLQNTTAITYVDKPTEFLESNETPYTSATVNQQYENERSARFLYPIPMYIPQPEGRHACDDESGTSNDIDLPKHPDVLNRVKQGYDFILNSYHALYRSHSSFNNSTYVNETYKVGDDGKNTFLPYHDNTRDTYETDDGHKLPEAWDAGTYEPVYMNLRDAQKVGLADGDTVIVESPRAKIMAAVRTSEIYQPKTLKIAEGSWFCLKDVKGIDGKVDVGGSVSSLMEKRPARVGQGSVNAGGCRVKIYKYNKGA